jgi:hypothetical protein
MSMKISNRTLLLMILMCVATNGSPLCHALVVTFICAVFSFDMACDFIHSLKRKHGWVEAAELIDTHKV